MDELVGPERVRDLEPHRSPAAVDEHAAAASQPQLGRVVIDVLPPGGRPTTDSTRYAGARPSTGTSRSAAASRP